MKAANNMEYKVFYHNVRACGKEFASAGIAVFGENGELLKRIFDVSTDFTALENLVESLNKNQIEYSQLDDIIEDFYAEHY